MKKSLLSILLLWSISTVYAQYPYMRIADVTVTNENQDNITSDFITGTVRYESDSHTLILQNATIYRYDSGDPYDDSNGNTIIIEAHGQTVNIELIGANTIFGVQPLVLHNGSYNIIGTGSLVLNGITEGVFCELGVDSFRIRKGASVVIDVPYWPSAGFQGSSQYQDYDLTVLSIDSGTLIINADHCIQSVASFLLNGSYIVSPEGAYYDPESRTLVAEDGPVRNYLEIRPRTVGIKEHNGNQFRVRGSVGGIFIDNVQERSSVEILNMLGQVICRTFVDNTGTFIPIEEGIYVVRVNNFALKVIVK